MVDWLDCRLSFKLTMGNIITLCPRLTVTEVEMETAFVILEECIGQVAADMK